MSHSLSLSAPILHPRALLTPAETRVMDQAASLNIEDLMVNAGTMAARIIRQNYKPMKILVACGPGNNGGDGLVLASILKNQGWPVSVTLLKSEPSSYLTKKMLAKWDDPIIPFVPEEAKRFDLVIDALFGAGMNRALPHIVEKFLEAAKRRIAIDLPSGVEGETGLFMGKVAPCEMSICFVRPRPAHYLSPALKICGKIKCADIAMPTSALKAVSPHIWHNDPSLWQLPTQHFDDHKYKRGVVSLVGGKDMPGAAHLSAAAARRVGAGMVRIVTSPEEAPYYRIGSAGLIIDDDLDTSLEDPRREVWICGPGLPHQKAGNVLKKLLDKRKSIIADAGALSWAAGDLSRLKGVKVITPHAGEFARLFPLGDKTRLKAAISAAKELDSVIVLKGEDTIIAAPDGRVAINSHASTALATAGTGDVLTGVIGALLSGGMHPWEASCAAVWIHGQAGQMAAKEYGGWPLAEDVVTFLGKSRHVAEQKMKKQ
ncbi:NAD(P)H-hydrate dehydratase [Aristophania vespae]|uniref:NAD(P)H-hydrate dehydratase n=1 Tax=Aristophania vespae TaxID=2697033 RepID=UPI002351AB97|nr:NAD(P)H-hydrate dehydratase [Aristophania vespae]UMM63386.1 Bifunctional NAD(P)H-hydrate repair enzyme Nnr [Aristophania vespae]